MGITTSSQTPNKYSKLVAIYWSHFSKLESTTTYKCAKKYIEFSGDALQIIFSYLPLPQICNSCMRVSKFWYIAASSDTCWSMLCKFHLFLNPCSKKTFVQSMLPLLDECNTNPCKAVNTLIHCQFLNATDPCNVFDFLTRCLFLDKRVAASYFTQNEYVIIGNSCHFK